MMNDAKKALSMISLAQKAGKTASGELACEAAVRSGEAKVVILSQDASATTEKKFSNRCFYYHVPLVRIEATKEEIGRAIGKGFRSVLAVCEAGLADHIISLTENISL